MSRYLSHLAALTLHQVEPVQPRLASRFETPVDKGLAGHTGLDVALENPASMPHKPMQASPVTATNSFDHTKLMQPRQASQFETPVVGESSGNSRLDVAPEAQVSKLHQPVQPSAINVTDKPVMQTVITASAEGKAKKASKGQDQPKVVQPIEFRVKEPESFAEGEKTPLNKNFSLVDKEHVIPAVQAVNKPVDRLFQAVRQDMRPPEHLRTLVERVQEHFTETTHNEFIIRGVTQPTERQTIIKPDASMPAVPIKPVSIKQWPEQSIAGLNSPRQSSNQQLMAEQSGTVATPEPTIQVTIGRIEIRATQIAQKPEKKSHATSNTLSLDDYLKQRNGAKS